MGSKFAFQAIGIYIGYSKQRGESRGGKVLGFHNFFDEDNAWLWIVVVFIILLVLFADD